MPTILGRPHFGASRTIEVPVVVTCSVNVFIRWSRMVASPAKRAPSRHRWSFWKEEVDHLRRLARGLHDEDDEDEHLTSLNMVFS